MRASRLLSIQMMLETRGRVSARTLAEKLEVSIRTLYRDVDELAAAGVPIHAERGRNGGFVLQKGWKTTLTGLTAAEAQSILMLGLSGPAADLGLGDDVARAELKLLTALPMVQRTQASLVRSKFHLDPIDWYREAQPAPALALVAQAVWDQRQITMAYESWKATVRRTAHPIGLVLKGGSWYLIAAVDGSPRTYRVASIQHVDLLDAPAKCPDGFDLARYWSERVHQFESDLYPGVARVRATRQGLRELSRSSARVARSLASQTLASDAEGWFRASIPIETEVQAVRQLVSMALDVEVLAPKSLRQAIRDFLEASGARYRQMTEVPPD
ncbi:MAG: WYL domain-containing protein [Ahniella sp.]|nr:WYL domain-containing protein [Ahniella sp.]